MTGLLISQAFAHEGHFASELSWWKSWTWSPQIVLALTLFSAAYFSGWIRLRRYRSASPWIGRLYALGISFLVLALLSPIDAWSDYLGSIHMIQHTLIMMVAAPLLSLASPGYVLLWAVPRAWWLGPKNSQRSIAQLLRLTRYSRPISIALFYAFVLWVWHIPLLYEWALQNPWVHDFQHLGFFFGAFLFWRVLFDPYIRGSLHAGAGILYLFVSSLHPMILGALMALSPVAWYEPYRSTAPLFGISALQDQQLAGYIMWMPAGLTYVVAVIVLSFRLIRKGSRSAA